MPGMQLQHIVTKARGTAMREPYSRCRAFGAYEREYMDVRVQTPRGMITRTWRTDSVRTLENVKHEGAVKNHNEDCMMISMKIILDAEGIAEGKTEIIHLKNQITVGALAHGMESGKPSVCFMFDLPDGKTVLAETSLALFVTAARAFLVKFGEPRV